MIRPSHILKLSAKSQAALDAVKIKYIDYLKNNKDIPLADITFSANTGRTDFTHRAVAIAENHELMASALDQKSGTDQTLPLIEGKVSKKRPKIAFIFSGQGAQYTGMGKALYDADADFRQHIDQCSEFLKEKLHFSLDQLLWGDKQEFLQETRYTQPALYALQTGLIAYLKRSGVSADAVLGHSVGEYAAAFCAGILSLEDGLKLIQARGELMWDHCQRGSMLAVFKQPSAIADYVAQHKDKISFAAFNGERSTVVAGDTKQLEDFAQQLAKQDIKSVPLRVSHGFHSVQMEPMLSPFAQQVATIEFKKPRLAFFSTVTANKETESVCQQEYWVDHVKKPVNFKDAVKALADSGIDAFVEIGPGSTLTTLGQMNCTLEGSVWLNSQLQDQEWPTLLNCLGELYVRGTPVKWRGVDQPYQCKRVLLPTYPFQKKLFWLDEEMLNLPLPPGTEQSRALEHLFKIDWQSVTSPKVTSSDQRILVIGPDLDNWQPLLDMARAQKIEPTTLALNSSQSKDSWDGEDQEFIAEFVNTNGPFQHTIVLAPASTPDFGQQQQALTSYDQSSQLAMGLSTLLAAYVTSEGKLALGNVHVVTTGAQILPGDTDINPAHAILWGIGKTASLEYAHMWGGLKDLPRTPTKEDYTQLLQQLSNFDFEDQWATRSGSCYIARIKAQKKVVGTSIKIDDTGAYIITGGLGGIGLTAAKHLVNQGAKHLILMSRRGQSTLTDPSKSALAELVNNWRTQEITIDLVAADLSDQNSLGTALTKIQSSGVEVKGIVHAAGIEQSSLIHEMTAEHLQQTIAAKTTGAWLLHEFANQYENLEFFICCSSISGVWGSGALAAYSAGNLALDSLCQYRRLQGKPATSVSWGPWAEVGMATSEESQQLVESGLVPLNPEKAAFSLFALSQHNLSHNIVVDADWSKFIPILEVRHPRPFFAELKPNNGDTVANDQSDALLKEIQHLSAKEQHTFIINAVRRDIAEILGFDSPAEISIDSPLLDIGADSIQAVAIKNSLESKLGKTLPTTLIFDYPTIDDIANFIGSSLGTSQPSEQPTRSTAQLDNNDIAIIGVACRLPGKSETPEDFWNLLVEARDGVIDEPNSRFDVDTFLSTDRGEQGKAYTLATGLVEGIEDFDASFFSISPREAKVLEPQQRMALECTWSALENAGYAPGSLNRSNTGVYFGAAGNDYLTLCQADSNLSDAAPHFATGNNLNVIGGRVSYSLGLMGPSVTLDTACSSSLVAVHTACQSLITQDCDMAIAGGTNAICTPFGHVMLCQSQMLSPTGRCHRCQARRQGGREGRGGWGARKAGCNVR